MITCHLKCSHRLLWLQKVMLKSSHMFPGTRHTPIPAIFVPWTWTRVPISVIQSISSTAMEISAPLSTFARRYWMTQRSRVGTQRLWRTYSGKCALKPKATHTCTRTVWVLIPTGSNAGTSCKIWKRPIGHSGRTMRTSTLTICGTSKEIFWWQSWIHTTQMIHIPSQT